MNDKHEYQSHVRTLLIFISLAIMIANGRRDCDPSAFNIV
jgi:hypothetical protein